MSNEKQNNEEIENENSQNQPDDLTKEMPDISDNAYKTKKVQIIAIMLFAGIMALFLIFSFFSGHKKEVKEKDNEISTKVQTKKLDFTPVEKNFKELVLDKEIPEQNASIQVDDEDENPFVATRKIQTFTPKVFKSSSAMITNSSSSTNQASSTSDTTNTDDPTIMQIASGEYKYDENGKLVRNENYGGAGLGTGLGGGDYDSGTFTPTIAKHGKFDPNLFLPKGTYIGCSLDTRLVSTIKGGISCTVSENIYSANGITLLIEKGSRINGFFNSGQMKDGMDRIFVVWQEIRTPNNIIIPVASGASDELGGSGIVGYVDHHYLQRFGAAILLSIIDDATNVALNGGTGTRSKQNSDYTEATRETTREMANTVLSKFINIEPTLYKNQGDIVGVYVNRDIDFSKVYKLKVQKGIRK